jgi:hypothetical protein
VGRIEEKIGMLAAAQSVEDQAALVRLLRCCQPTVSVARELFENLVDVSQREGRSISEILSVPALAATLEDEGKSAPERAAALRHHVHRLRYARLAAAEARFARTHAALHLPPSMRLDPPPNFESDEMRLEIRFRNEERLRDSVAALSRLLDDPSLLGQLWPNV